MSANWRPIRAAGLAPVVVVCGVAPGAHFEPPCWLVTPVTIQFFDGHSTDKATDPLPERHRDHRSVTKRSWGFGASRG